VKGLFMKNSFDGIEIRNSSVDGKGVFATRDFRKNEIIIKWDISHKLTQDQYNKLSKEERRYVAKVHNQYIVNQVPAKYVNHSCDANTSVKDYCDVAIRDIRKGEEITANYLED
jgi:SET domain-containing protein